MVVVDEGGQFAISLASGHMGGANELTRQVAACLGATPVVTTATDVNGRVAVDVFAVKNGLAITSMRRAKEISAAILAGKPVGLHTELPLEGEVPPELTLGRVPAENVEIGFHALVSRQSPSDSPGDIPGAGLPAGNGDAGACRRCGGRCGLPQPDLPGVPWRGLPAWI